MDPMTQAEMERYTGRRAVPKDFDLFWDQQLQEIQDVPNFDLKPKPLGMENVDANELRFRGTNGSIIYAKVLFPKGEEKVPMIFHFHGYQGRSGDWSDYFKYVLAGYGVVAMDVRGQAGESEDHGTFDGITVKGQIIRGMLDGPEHLFYKDVFLDVDTLIEIVAGFDNVDENNLQTLGGSQGGALAIAGAALNQRIQQATITYPFLIDYPRVMELHEDVEPYDELYRYFKTRDPLYKTQDQVLATLDYIDMKNFAHRIKAKVNLITGLRDEVCPPSTQYAFYNRLITTQKEHYIVPQFGHEPMKVAIPDLIMNLVTGTRI